MRGQFFAAALLVSVQGLGLKPEPVTAHPSDYLLALEHQLSFGPFGAGYNEYHAPEPSYHPSTPSYHEPTPSYHAPEPKHDVVSKYFTPKPYPTQQPDYSDVPDVHHKPHHKPHHEPHHEPYVPDAHHKPEHKPFPFTDIYHKPVHKPLEKPVCDRLANPNHWYPHPVPDIYHDTRCFDYPKPNPISIHDFVEKHGNKE